MKQHRNGWFAAAELPRALQVITETIADRPTNWLNVPAAKYINIRIDQRTGDFLLKDQDGAVLEEDQLRTLYPDLFS